MHMWEKSQGHILNWFNSFSCSCICLLLFFCLFACFGGVFFLPLREMQELPGKGDQESAVRRLPWVILQSAGRPGTKHGPDCVLLFFTQVNFLQSLHGHRSILLYHDNKTGPAPLDGSFCVASGVAGVKHWVTFTGATQEVCSRKQKVPEQPLRFCFLCGLYWCLLLAYIFWYIWGEGINSKRSRYFWSREAMCVSDYCHFVLLSEKSLGFFFWRVI